MNVDDIIELALLEARLIHGENPARVAATGGALGERLADSAPMLSAAWRDGRQPFWTPDELEFLDTNAATMSVQQMAEALGRTINAVKVRRTRRGLLAVTRNPDLMSGRDVAQALGIACSKTITRWVERGLLTPAPIELETGWLFFPRRQITRFAVNPQNWVYFSAGRVRDPHLKRLVTMRQARWGDAWLTTSQAAAYYNRQPGRRGPAVDAKDMLRMVLHGRVIGVQKGEPNSAWFVKRSSLDGLVIAKGKGARQRERSLWPEAMLEYTWLAMALGYSRQGLAASLGVSDSTIDNKRARLMRRPRDFAMRTGALRRGKQLYADWTQHAGRFPALARAMSNLNSGRRLTPAQRHLAVGWLYQYAAWYMPRHPVVRRLNYWRRRLPSTPLLRELRQQLLELFPPEAAETAPLRDSRREDNRA